MGLRDEEGITFVQYVIFDNLKTCTIYDVCDFLNGISVLCSLCDISV